VVISDVVLRLHPVEPLGLVAVVSKPPSNHPQETLAALRRSSILVPVMLKVSPVVVEQISPAGSVSLKSVSPPLPSSTSAPVHLCC